MTGRFLLDTNVIVALFANDPAVCQYLTGDTEVFLPAIALGELYYGAYKSLRVKDNIARIDGFASACVTLAVDPVTAQWYGQIKDKLRKLGRLIPENDIWIAAIAQQHDLALITRDSHFEGVDGLPLQKW